VSVVDCGRSVALWRQHWRVCAVVRRFCFASLRRYVSRFAHVCVLCQCRRSLSRVYRLICVVYWRAHRPIPPKKTFSSHATNQQKKKKKLAKTRAGSDAGARSGQHTADDTAADDDCRRRHYRQSCIVGCCCEARRQGERARASLVFGARADIGVWRCTARHRSARFRRRPPPRRRHRKMCRSQSWHKRRARVARRANREPNASASSLVRFFVFVNFCAAAAAAAERARASARCVDICTTITYCSLYLYCIDCHVYSCHRRLPQHDHANRTLADDDSDSSDDDDANDSDADVNGNASDSDDDSSSEDVPLSALAKKAAPKPKKQVATQRAYYAFQSIARQITF
jgi:hypothetical protein